MTHTSITQITLRLIAGCSLALMTAATGGPVLAHNHHDDHNSGASEHHYHHHHHHHPPLHGSGSSHHPIVYHPPVKPIPKPVVGVGPVKQAGTTVVRDHRTPPSHVHGGGRPNSHCNDHNITGCTVRDHRAPPPTQCLGNLC